jgi:hypothetical protein
VLVDEICRIISLRHFLQGRGTTSLDRRLLKDVNEINKQINQQTTGYMLLYKETTK